MKIKHGSGARAASSLIGQSSLVGLVKLAVGGSTLLFVASCGGGDGAAAWSAFSTCLIGEEPLKEGEVIADRLYAIELAEKVPKSAGNPESVWPHRCASYANTLYKAIDDSGQTTVLKRSLNKSLGCVDEGKCEFPWDVPSIPGAFNIWEAAKLAGFVYAKPSGVPVPKVAKPTQGTDLFKPLVDKDLTLGDAMRLPNGDVTFLFRPAPEKKAPLTVCTATSKGVSCQSAHADVAPMPAHSVRLLREPDAIYVSGIAEAKETEPGKPPQITRRGFELVTGKEVKFAGPAERERKDGLVVERGDNDEGLVAMLLKGGRTVKKLALDVPGKPELPVVVGDSFAYVTEKLVVGTLTTRGVVDDTEHAGISGTPMSCVAPGGGVFGVWGRAAHQKDAKPTEGKDQTKVAFVFVKDGKLSKPVTGTIPFDRRMTTPLVCDGTTARLGWAMASEDFIEVGRLECTADKCESKTSKFPALPVQQWALVADAGDNLAVMWTTVLGDTRLRVGAPGDFSSAKETILFDSAERGGPKLRRLDVFSGSGFAYLLVQDDGPQLLAIGPNGEVAALSGK